MSIDFSNFNLSVERKPDVGTSRIDLLKKWSGLSDSDFDAIAEKTDVNLSQIESGANKDEEFGLFIIGLYMFNSYPLDELTDYEVREDFFESYTEEHGDRDYDWSRWTQEFDSKKNGVILSVEFNCGVDEFYVSHFSIKKVESISSSQVKELEGKINELKTVLDNFDVTSVAEVDNYELIVEKIHELKFALS